MHSIVRDNKWPSRLGMLRWVLSLVIVVLIMAACLALIAWIIRTGWRLRH